MGGRNREGKEGREGGREERSREGEEGGAVRVGWGGGKIYCGRVGGRDGEKM